MKRFLRSLWTAPRRRDRSPALTPSPTSATFTHEKKKKKRNGMLSVGLACPPSVWACAPSVWAWTGFGPAVWACAPSVWAWAGLRWRAAVDRQKLKPYTKAIASSRSNLAGNIRSFTRFRPWENYAFTKTSKQQSPFTWCELCKAASCGEKMH